MAQRVATEASEPPPMASGEDLRGPITKTVRLPVAREDELAAGIHEIQNALTGVLGWLEIARTTADAELKSRALRVIDTGVQRARALVAGLADPDERFGVRARTFDAAQLLDETFELVEPRCAGAGVTLERNFAKDAVYAHGDPDRIVQIVTNLVLNAADAILAVGDGIAGHGRVSLSMITDETTVQIAVGDNGIGMDAATLARVFEPHFTTHPQASGKRTKGTGLGMAISRALADAMEARLRVDSTLGVGTTVTLVLPREGALPSVKPPPDDAVLRRGTRILVVDDEPTIRELLEVALALRGADVKTAGSLREARHALAHNVFDVVVVDDTLGVSESGAALVQDLSHAMPAMVCVLMTGAPTVDHLPADAARWLLRKPFALDDVVRLVARAIKHSSTQPPPA